MQLLLFAVCIYTVSAQLEGWENYYLAWSDYFDGNEIDSTKWDHEITATGGGNNEFQVYADDPMNSYVRDGILYLKPSRLKDNTNPHTGQPYGEEFLVNGVLDLYALYGRCTNSDNDGCYRLGDGIPPVMSARIRTAERFSFKYGRTRIRARMPAGDWLWPAMWLLPEHWVFGGWPRSGEIDIVETIGNENFKYNDGSWAGYQHMGTTLHWGPSPEQNRFYLTNVGWNNDTNNYAMSWHLYEMEWNENGFRMVVDDQEIANFPNPLISNNPDWTGWYDFGAPYEGQPNPGWDTPSAPFDQEFHFILNVAVGGTSGMIPDDGTNRDGDPQFAKPWSNCDGYYDAFKKFYGRQNDWYWTWEKEGENNAMQVDFIEVYQLI